MIDEAIAKAEARRLQRKAQAHKRTSAAERRAARDTLDRLGELLRTCNEAGIELVLEPGLPKPNTEPRRHSDRRGRT